MIHVRSAPFEKSYGRIVEPPMDGVSHVIYDARSIMIFCMTYLNVCMTSENKWLWYMMTRTLFPTKAQRPILIGWHLSGISGLLGVVDGRFLHPLLGGTCPHFNTLRTSLHSLLIVRYEIFSFVGVRI